MIERKLTQANRMRLTVLLFVGLVLLSGCSGLVGTDEGEAPTETTAVTETATETDVTTTESALSDQEEEYVFSGNEFAEIFDDYTGPHNHTRYLDHRAYANNTVELAIQTDGEVSAERSVMDGTQAVAAAVYYATREGEPPRRDNGSLRFLHEPESVTVYMYGPNRDPVGAFDVDPAAARDYREHNLSSPAFAAQVMDTYEPENSYERVDRPNSWYLNHSELTIFASDYREEAQRWAANNGELGAEYPVDGVQINATRHEILHEVVWDRSVYDQNYISGRAVMLAAYYRTAEDSYAMPPERLNMYVELPENEDDDYAAVMNRSSVYTFLGTDRGNDARNWYLDQYEYWFPDKGEHPFEGF